MLDNVLRYIMFSKYDACHPLFPFKETKQCENIVCNNKIFFVKNFNFLEIFREKVLNLDENWVAISLRNALRKLGNFHILGIVWNVQFD